MTSRKSSCPILVWRYPKRFLGSRKMWCYQDGTPKSNIRRNWAHWLSSMGRISIRSTRANWATSNRRSPRPNLKCDQMDWITIWVVFGINNHLWSAKMAFKAPFRSTKNEEGSRISTEVFGLMSLIGSGLSSYSAINICFTSEVNT